MGCEFVWLTMGRLIKHGMIIFFWSSVFMKIFGCFEFCKQADYDVQNKNPWSTIKSRKMRLQNFLKDVVLFWSNKSTKIICCNSANST